MGAETGAGPNRCPVTAINKLPRLCEKQYDMQTSTLQIIKHSNRVSLEPATSPARVYNSKTRLASLNPSPGRVVDPQATEMRGGGQMFWRGLVLSS